MKHAFAVLLLSVLLGCGGRPPAPLIITADEVFQNRAETWLFQNGHGHICSVEVLPQPDGSTTWHYTKTDADCYWGPNIPGAELYFNLAKDGADWYSTGGRFIFPQGCPWCAGPVDLTYGVNTDPGQPRPYKIIASGITSYQTTLLDNGVPGTRWRTDSYAEHVNTPAYTGMALVSEQWEGPCIHEKWWFAPGKGLVKVAPLDQGDCKGLPAALTIVRIN